MELTVLGAHGTWPLPDGATSGYLVRHDGFSMWVDLGTGSMANLQRYVDVATLDAALISHRHPDHLLDVFPFFYARLFSPDCPMGFPLLAAPGVFPRMQALASDEGVAAMSEVFDMTEVEPGQALEVGPFRIGTALMAHPVPTIGLRMEAGGATIAYSADTGPSDDLVELSKGCDLLLAEANYLEPEDGPPIHLSGRQTGEHAERAGVDRLMLTHIRPTLDREAVADRAREGFGGEVLLAREGLRWVP